MQIGEDVNLNKNMNNNESAVKESDNRKATHNESAATENDNLGKELDVIGDQGLPNGTNSIDTNADRDFVFNGKVEVCSPHLIAAASLADANMDVRDSETDTFSRLGPNVFEQQIRRRRRGKQIGLLVLIGAVACTACTMGILYAQDEEKINHLEEMDAVGVARSRGRNIYDCDDDSMPKCEETGHCVNILGNASISHLCICNPGFHGLKCERDFCHPNPCVGQERCDMNSNGIPRCISSSICDKTASGARKSARREVSVRKSARREVSVRKSARREVSAQKFAARNDVSARREVSVRKSRSSGALKVDSRCHNNGICLPYAVQFNGVKSDFACGCRKGFFGMHCAHAVGAAAGSGNVRDLVSRGIGNSGDKERNFTFTVGGGGGGGGGVGNGSYGDGGVTKEQTSGDAVTPLPPHLIARPLPCVGVDCLNGGFCTNLDTIHWKCVCTTDFKGKKCEEKLRPCEVKKCANDGICVEESDSVATCSCLQEFHGETCQYHNGCASNPCFGDASCAPFGESRFTCRCGVAWMGDLCHISNPCHSSPCLNGGTCNIKMNRASEVTGYTCSCDTRHFVGSRCEIVSPCSSSPCQNSGTCEAEEQNNIFRAKCYCDWQSWVGLRCEVRSACAKYPCANMASCRPKMDGEHRSCYCKKGYEGENCEIYQP